MIEFRAERPIWTGCLELYARQQDGGKMSALVADGIKLVEIQEGMRWPKFLELATDEAAGQSLFDALWKIGYRPHSGESSVAHVEAMKYHLEDMRKLVFKAKA